MVEKKVAVLLRVAVKNCVGAWLSLLCLLQSEMKFNKKKCFMLVKRQSKTSDCL
ncbi:hypothetical protein POPTR_007G003150v4 [Populus trichocarpa]|uniref:Uncharacterized protein n=1 Tax=Populus trichocarpa TaxID=3694 RepID=A0ACC0SNJ3_POPTR|nr:hypothetical protein POPTR_007G003150v4 [Populus trichocarpa]